MKLTAKSRYALLAMLDLALGGTDKPEKLSDIAKRQGVSKTYLEQLFNKLRRSGLIKSIRGRQGGYYLDKEVGQITLAQIIYAMEEGVDMTRCGGRQNCQKNQRCLLHDLLMELNQHVSYFLNNITLGELVEKNNVQTTYKRQINIISQNS